MLNWADMQIYNYTDAQLQFSFPCSGYAKIQLHECRVLYLYYYAQSDCLVKWFSEEILIVNSHLE